jgi:hemolysin activation/secretion protein
VHQTIWSGRFDCGAPLARRHVLAARGEWHALVSAEAETPVSELFEFGGARTLRGYREGQFRGEQVAYGGIEYRYGDPRVAQFYLFADGGALRRRLADAPREESLHAGTGAGLRARVANGAMDVSFGLGEERSFSALKAHVSFVQSF